VIDEALRPILESAERDPNVLGVALKGSRAMGIADELSDWDLVVVLSEGEPSHEKTGDLDVLTTTLGRLQKAPAWELPAIAHAQVLLDKTGDVAAAIEAAGRLSRDELAELYDSYLNDFYRSLKAWRRGRELAARIKAARSLWWLGEFLLALEGRRAPYPSAWGGRLGELEPLMLEVARTSDPRRQQELQAAVEQVASAHGFRDVYDGWNGEIDRVMSFDFD
jgi:predicted nucleotidyltransferase